MYSGMREEQWVFLFQFLLFVGFFKLIFFLVLGYGNMEGCGEKVQRGFVLVSLAEFFYSSYIMYSILFVIHITTFCLDIWLPLLVLFPWLYFLGIYVFCLLIHLCISYLYVGSWVCFIFLKRTRGLYQEWKLPGERQKEKNELNWTKWINALGCPRLSNFPIKFYHIWHNHRREVVKVVSGMTRLAWKVKFHELESGDVCYVERRERCFS